MWSSDQERSRQHEDTEENARANGQPDVVYAEIYGKQDLGKVTPPKKEDDTVVYSELQNLDAPNHTMAPSNDLYENYNQ